MPHARPARPPLSIRSIRIRDPFIVPLRERGEYLMFGTNMLDEIPGAAPGFNCFRSRDLTTWDGPIPCFRASARFWGTRDYWAPEVHHWNGRWYMLASFIAPGSRRGTHALVADRPEGPYEPLGADPLTPQDWECLDGTLHIEDGRPWLVFCHEWLQVGDGGVYALPLADDLSRPSGPPVLLFTASQATWTIECGPHGGPGGAMGRVTDGPWLHRLPDGQLIMLWSSFGENFQYCVAVVRSAGGVLGPWRHDALPLLKDDGGHGMLFRTFDGRLQLALHRPNGNGRERAFFQPMDESGSGLRLATVNTSSGDAAVRPPAEML